MLRDSDIRWGIQGCQSDGCPNDAELIWDEREAICVDCADKLLERLRILGEFGRDYIPDVPIGEWYEVVRPFRQWKRDENGNLYEVS